HAGPPGYYLGTAEKRDSPREARACAGATGVQRPATGRQRDKAVGVSDEWSVAAGFEGWSPGFSRRKPGLRPRIGAAMHHSTHLPSFFGRGGSWPSGMSVFHSLYARSRSAGLAAAS